MSRIDLQRLRLAEDLQNFARISSGFFYPKGPLAYLSEPDPRHPEGWRYLRLAGDQLRPLGSSHAARFEAVLKKDRGPGELRDEALQIVQEAFNEIAPSIYTQLPKRPEVLLDRLDAIMTDTNEVAALIVGSLNRSEQLRYLLELLREELRRALEDGRSTMSQSAKAAVRDFLEHVVTMSMNFNAMQYAEGERQSVWDKAYESYGKLPAILDRAGNEFRTIREEEKKQKVLTSSVTQNFHGPVNAPVIGPVHVSDHGTLNLDGNKPEKSKRSWAWMTVIVAAIITAVGTITAAMFTSGNWKLPLTAKGLEPVTKAYSSGANISGAGKQFSAWYELCSDPVPPGYRAAAVNFRLSGDRSCGEWANCERADNAGQVCFRFRLQGHDEWPPPGQASSEAALTVTFEPEAAK